MLRPPAFQVPCPTVADREHPLPKNVIPECDMAVFGPEWGGTQASGGSSKMHCDTVNGPKGDREPTYN